MLPLPLLGDSLFGKAGPGGHGFATSLPVLLHVFGRYVVTTVTKHDPLCHTIGTLTSDVWVCFPAALPLVSQFMQDKADRPLQERDAPGNFVRYLTAKVGLTGSSWKGQLLCVLRLQAASCE